MEAYLDEARLEEYLSCNEEKNPICREERQYALFLYLVFLEMRGVPIGKEDKKITEKKKWIIGKIKECLGEEKMIEENLTIKDVYYEANLMRDYFARCEGEEAKKDFNMELLHFCLDCLPCNKKEEHCGACADCNLWENDILVKKLVKEDIKAFFLGSKKMKEVIGEDKYKVYEEIGKKIGKNDAKLIYEKACLDIAGMMMNATPDLLVIYSKDQKTYAKALECKYLSDQGPYEDVIGSSVKMQYFIQECVMSFLFGKKMAYREEDLSWKLPKEPTKGRWHEGLGMSFELLKKNVYERILKYANKSNEQNGIINKGVNVIKFCEKEPGNRPQDVDECIVIKDLLKYMYPKQIDEPEKNQ